MSFLRPIPRALTFVGAAALIVALAAPVPVAGAQEGIAATMLIETTQGANEMKVTVEGESLRMDMDSGQGQVSMVWLSDRMLMIMHPQRMYMEFTEEMMERMRGMMQNMPNAPDIEEQEVPDFSEFTFERTGNTDTINGMSAFEVAMSGPDVDHDARLWMTEDSDVGMFEVFAPMGEAMASMNLPMMRQGDSPADMMQDYMSMARAQGLPAGKVIRVVNTDNGDSVTITLQSVEHGPFGADMFAAPSDYTKQQMPMMQH